MAMRKSMLLSMLYESKHKNKFNRIGMSFLSVGIKTRDEFKNKWVLNEYGLNVK